MAHLLDSIRTSHPDLYRAFRSRDDAERQLQRIMELDRYWEQWQQPVPRVVLLGSELPSDVRCETSVDLLYAGGTLSLLHAAVMAFRYGRKVMVVDRHVPSKTTRDWNISRQELLRLCEAGVLSEEEMDSCIVRQYRTGWVEFFRPDGRQKRLYMDHVLDCAVDADRLLGILQGRIVDGPGCGEVLGGVRFEALYQFDDHVVVRLVEGSRVRYVQARVFLDGMGIVSPVAFQLTGGRPQTHVCPTVGTIASGFEDVAMDVGEILMTTGNADMGFPRGRQLIWEGFPAGGDEYITYLFFYDSVDSPNDRSLLSLFDRYFKLLPEYKRPGPDFVIHRPVYGIIPAYFHDGFGCTRVVADDHVLLLGDAASLASPLTFCGFGSMVRNLGRMTAGLEDALQRNRLKRRDLEKVSAYEPNVAAMANLMKYMCFDRRTDAPDFVNELMNEVMVVLDGLPERYRQAMFRDEMTVDELVGVMLRVAGRYPRVLVATWEKLGLRGSGGFLKNLAGWALQSGNRVAGS